MEQPQASQRFRARPSAEMTGMPARGSSLYVGVSGEIEPRSSKKNGPPTFGSPFARLKSIWGNFPGPNLTAGEAKVNAWQPVSEALRSG